MVNFFHRTSTFQVYELAIFEETLDIDYIHDKMIELGHKRKESDVKGMVTILNHFGLFENKFKEKAKTIDLESLEPSKTQVSKIKDSSNMKENERNEEAIK